MRNAEEVISAAVEIANRSGCKPGNITAVKVNSRAKTRLGRCSLHRLTGEYTIELSNRVLRDNIPPDALMSVAVHEVLHTCPGCMNHGTTWQVQASKVMRLYPELKIQRVADLRDFGLQEEQIRIIKKYSIRCSRCGMIHYSSRMSASIKNPERYRCGRCGGKMIRT